MDSQLEKYFAQKLCISQEKVKHAYREALKEYAKETTDNEAVETIEKKLSCVYKFSLGKNNGKNCNKDAKYEFEEKSYCAAHYKTVKEKKTRSNSLKLKDNTVSQKKIEVKTSSSQHNYETEKHNEHLVLKGTLLIVDKDHNCCLGKYEKDELTDKITREDQSKLEELKIPYHHCTVLDLPLVDIEKDLEESEEIVL